MRAPRCTIGLPDRDGQPTEMLLEPDSLVREGRAGERSAGPATAAGRAEQGAAAPDAGTCAVQLQSRVDVLTVWADT